LFSINFTMGNSNPINRKNRADDFLHIDTLPDIEGIDGEVNVNVHNKDGDGGSVLAVHGSNNFKAKEWKCVADLIRKVHDLEMYVIDASAGPCGENLLRNQVEEKETVTEPSLDKVTKLLDHLMGEQQARHDEKGLLLFGEGWGTQAMVNLAFKEKAIKAVILANCTAEEDLEKLHERNLPILFLYHADDQIVADVQTAWAKEWDGDGNIQFVEVKKSDLTEQDKQNNYVMSQPFLWPILKFMKEKYISGHPMSEQERLDREEDEKKHRISEE